VVSGISGFFDGQLGKPGLQPRCAFQWLLVAATLGISGLATARVVQLIRHR
jgi:hypothetical protein